MTPLMIVADTYAAARFYANEHDLGPEGRAWRYVTSPWQVRGYRDGEWVRIRTGDYLPTDARADRADAMDALWMAGFTHVEDA